MHNKIDINFECHPNPFNSITSVNVQLPTAGFVKMSVFDLLGRTVLTYNTGFLETGVHRLSIDGSNLANGIYYLRISIPGKFEETRKIVLLR